MAMAKSGPRFLIHNFFYANIIMETVKLNWFTFAREHCEYQIEICSHFGHPSLHLRHDAKLLTFFDFRAWHDAQSGGASKSGNTTVPILLTTVHGLCVLISREPEADHSTFFIEDHKYSLVPARNVRPMLARMSPALSLDYNITIVLICC